MPALIRWKPSTAPNIVLYTLLYSDTGPDGQFDTLAQVPNIPSGPNYDIDTALYFYTATSEISYRLYRLSTIDAMGTVFTDTTSPPFGPDNDPYTIPVPNTFPLNENHTGVGAYSYVDPNGSPIAGATVRVYLKEDWDLQRYSKVVGLTTTTSTGGWLSPILVEPGNTFVLHYFLPNVFGPDTVEVTI